MNCPSCHAPAQPGATHCGHCRAPLGGGGGWGPNPGSAPGYGAPQGGYGAPPAAAGGYGAPAAAPGGYGAPPAPGGYGAPQGGGYGPPPAQGAYGAPPGIPGPALPAFGGPQPAPGGFGPQPYGAPGMGSGGMGPGMAPGPQIPAYGGGGQPAKSGGLGGCGIAAIIGAAVALLGGIGLVLLLVAASGADDDDDAPSRPVVTDPAPGPAPGPTPQADAPLRDDIPDTGALRVLIKDRVGAYVLSATGEITSLAPILQGGVVDSKAAQYRAPNGALVELFLVAYSSKAVAEGKMLALHAALNAEKAPHEIVTRSPVFNKSHQVVGTRLRVQNSVPNEAVYWTNGRLLGFVRAPAPHAVGFELVAPF